MAIEFTTNKELMLVDSYNLDWSFTDESGKIRKGSTPMVGLYDVDEHRFYHCSFDCDLSACINGEFYNFKLAQVVKYNKAKMIVKGVDNE